MSPEYLISLAGALMVGSGIWTLFESMTRPRRRTAAQASYIQEGLEVHLSRNRLPCTLSRFLTEGAIVGALLAGLSYLATNSIGALIPMFVCGFVVTNATYEGKRDALSMEYNAGIALASSQISNAWLAQPSISNAMEAVITYGQADVASDFEEARAAMSAGKNISDAFAPIADRRRSPFLDGLIMALISADRATGDIRQLLEGIADSTRDQVEIFKDYVVASANARQEVLWAVFSPWVLVLVSRGMSIMPGSGEGELSAVFNSPIGLIGLFIAGSMTLAGYRSMTRAAQKGIIMDRIRTEET